MRANARSVCSLLRYYTLSLSADGKSTFKLGNGPLCSPRQMPPATDSSSDSSTTSTTTAAVGSFVAKRKHKCFVCLANVNRLDGTGSRYNSRKQQQQQPPNETHHEGIFLSLPFFSCAHQKGMPELLITLAVIGPDRERLAVSELRVNRAAAEAD